MPRARGGDATTTGLAPGDAEAVTSSPGRGRRFRVGSRRSVGSFPIRPPSSESVALVCRHARCGREQATGRGGIVFWPIQPAAPIRPAAHTFVAGRRALVTQRRRDRLGGRAHVVARVCRARSLVPPITLVRPSGRHTPRRKTLCNRMSTPIATPARRQNSFGRRGFGCAAKPEGGGFGRGSRAGRSTTRAPQPAGAPRAKSRPAAAPLIAASPRWPGLRRPLTDLGVGSPRQECSRTGRSDTTGISHSSPGVRAPVFFVPPRPKVRPGPSSWGGGDHRWMSGVPELRGLRAPASQSLVFRSPGLSRASAAVPGHGLEWARGTGAPPEWWPRAPGSGPKTHPGTPWAFAPSPRRRRSALSTLPVEHARRFRADCGTTILPVPRKHARRPARSLR